MPSLTIKDGKTPSTIAGEAIDAGIDAMNMAFVHHLQLKDAHRQRRERRLGHRTGRGE